MTQIREYLVRTPDGHDYGRDASLVMAKFAAIDLGDGAKVIALDDFLLPIREDGVEKVVYEVGASEEEEADETDEGALACPYHRCGYRATDAGDLEEHLISMPTEAPEHWREGDSELPKRTPRTFDGQFSQA